MAGNFEELGLRPELVGAARDLGYMGPTALQSAAIPVLRRGGNALLHASAGAGTLAAYGLALLDRLAGAEGGEEGGGDGTAEARAIRALVLVPTDDDAARAAISLARFGRAAGIRVTALCAGWPAPREGAPAVVVATPAAAVDAVERSRLKLERAEAVVLDGASAIFALSGQAAVETVISLVPRDAQRIIVTAEVTGEVEDYAERHLRRALRIPPVSVEEPVPPAEVQPPRRLDYQVVAEWEKLEAAAALLVAGEPGRLPVVYCRSERRVEEVADALRLRGFHIRTTGAEEAEALAAEPAEVIVSAATVTTPADALVISYDVPFDAEGLLARHERGGTVLVTPRELPHLRQLAERETFELRSGGAAPAAPPQLVAEFRNRLRTALGEEDLGAQLLVLDPLFREFSPAEVAAAASALLRRRAVVPTAPAPGVARPVATRAAPAPSPSYVRLFVGVGERDGIVPSDLVGAITGEAQVRGGQVGRIDIRDTFSIVEVESEIASRVIQAVNGITLRGRSVRVDFDRRGGAPAARGGMERGRRRPPPPGARRGAPRRGRRRPAGRG
jgi:ATP-dependent RNA helicase DeaD